MGTAYFPYNACGRDMEVMAFSGPHLPSSVCLTIVIRNARCACLSSQEVEHNFQHYLPEHTGAHWLPRSF